MKTRHFETRTAHNDTISIPYELIYAKRKTLGITVHPDLRVSVRAPKGIAKRRVDKLVLKRATWILQHQERLRTAPPIPVPLKYVDGEIHSYLGTSYHLKVIKAVQNSVKLEGDCLYVYVCEKVPAVVKRVLEGWYRKRANEVFSERLSACYSTVAYLGFPVPEIKVRKMKRSWGIARQQGPGTLGCQPYPSRITLNVRLIKLPVESIDLVIFHELCHLIEPNHSKRFYTLLGHVLPDWKERRERMQKYPYPRTA